MTNRHPAKVGDTFPAIFANRLAEIGEDDLLEVSLARATTNQTRRPVSTPMEELLFAPIKVLDHGTVSLIDYMGDEAAIVQAARTSYGRGTRTLNEDRGLLRYLMRHKHSTPFEMCLSGDMRVPTFTRGRAQVKHYTMQQLAEAFAEGGKENSWVKLLRIRTVNPETGIVKRTRITKAWKTGKKKCYRVTVGDFNRSIEVTDNHPFLTPDGEYKTLETLVVGSSVMLNGFPATSKEVRNEVVVSRRNGMKLLDISSELDMPPSTVYKILKQEGLSGRMPRKTGFFKKAIGEHSDPRAIARRLVKKGPCKVKGCNTKGRDVHHKDEDPHNNDKTNLIRLCPKHHRHIHTYSTLKKAFPAKITSIEYVGVKDVYDLEVKSKHHNFVAEGFVVHNCEIKIHAKMPIFVARQWVRHRTASINEYSARYSVLDREFYVPSADQMATQSKKNKQGRDMLLTHEQAVAVQRLLREDAMGAYENYLGLLGEPSQTDLGSALTPENEYPGLARELARMNLSLNFYTQWYWKVDLANLMKFMSLRSDLHAQYEIRVYSDVLLDMLSLWMPNVHEAFLDYQMGAFNMSSHMLKVLRNSGVVITEADCLAEGMSKREAAELIGVLRSDNSKHRIKHLRKGDTYMLRDKGHLQTDIPLEDGAEIVSYKSETDGRVWFRRAEEMTDGRFELPPAE